MIVWLWDAPPRCGVSGSLGRAQEAAEKCLTSGRATSARVETALLAMSARTLQPLYERTGTAWLARPAGSEIRWEPIMPAGAVPALPPGKEP